MTTDITTSAGFVLSLNEKLNIATCGAKAWRLSEMVRMGCSVPPGVVISDKSFRQFLEHNHLDEKIAAILDRLDPRDLKHVAEAAHQIQELVLESPLPIDIERSIIDSASPLLAVGVVIVRSSAHGEDSGDAAFAGQLDSILGVKNPERLLAAVKQCWASYWSHRSLAYQLTRGVQLAGLGVLVQQQVNAKYSGVMFTSDPHRPDSGEMVLEYCDGLAEQLVSGEVSPERIIISGEAWRRESSAPPATENEISDSVIAELSDAARLLEDRFGGPQDIEWTVDPTDRLFLVQSRPVTAIMKTPATPVVWSNANVNENFPDPISPLLYSIASVGYYHYFKNLGTAFGISPKRIAPMDSHLQGIVGTHGGRIYYNLTNIHAVLRGAPYGEFLAIAFNRFVGADATESRSDIPNWSNQSRGRLSAALELLRIVTSASRRLRRMESGIMQFEQTIDAFARECRPENMANLSREQLLRLWREFMAIRCDWTHASIADAATMISYGLSHRLLSGEFSDEADKAIVNRFLSGLCNIVSGLPTEELWELSRQVQTQPNLLEVLRGQSAELAWSRIETDPEFSEFYGRVCRCLDQWGFRCSGELMLTRPCYQENPPELLELLKAYLGRNGESPKEQLARQQEKRSLETARIMAVLKRKPLVRFLPWPRKNWLAGRLIRWTQKSVACRERARLKQALLYSRIRQLTLRTGKELVMQGLLPSPEDVFFLTWQEIESLLSGRAMLPDSMAEIVSVRRAQHCQFAESQPPDRIELAPGDYWRPQQAVAGELDESDSEVHHGLGVASGTTVGRAVVLSDSSEFERVQEGDILVTRQTDPGWGPILFLVKGLVMERGGMLSHGAILAREFGIPTVVDIRNITQRIQTGDMLRVDGDRGIVEVLDQ